MQLEIEQKFPVKGFEQVRKTLAGLGAAFEQPVSQTDVYFRHPTRNFIQTDEALRLRRVGEENCITYKGPKIDQETKTRRELELGFGPGQKTFAAWAELLEILGFSRGGEVQKERTPGKLPWEGHEVHLALDTVAGLGTFLELEIVADEKDLPAAKKSVLSLAEKLDLGLAERRGYLTLLASKEKT